MAQDKPLPPHDHRFKIVLLGDPGVGKTSILFRYCEDTFPEADVMNIGIDNKSKIIEVKGKRACLEIWDTAGQERFRTISSSYYKGAHGIVLVYDITDEETYTNLRSWLSEIDRHLDENVTKILIGNKLDLDKTRTVERATAEDLAQNVEMHYEETSALDDTNIDKVFHLVAEHIIASGAAGNESKSPGVIQIGKYPRRKERCCS